jgi:hypothetical protein
VSYLPLRNRQDIEFVGIPDAYGIWKSGKIDGG